MNCSSISLFLAATDLGFLNAPYFLLSILPFFPLFSAFLWFLVQTVSLQAMFGLQLLSHVHRVVDQGETTRFATTDLCAESKAVDEIRRGLKTLC